jgi:hypothetical protein
MVKEKEVREAIQIAMWILCAFPNADEDSVATAVPATSSRAWRRSGVKSSGGRRVLSRDEGGNARG